MSEPIHIEYLPLGELLDRKAEKNPKRHDLIRLNRSIDRFGYTQPMLLDDRTNRLLAGHGRLETLIRKKIEGQAPPKNIKVADDGEWLVPVIIGYATNSDAEAKAYIVADNRLTEIGGWDPVELGELLTDLVDEGGVDMLDGTGFNSEEYDLLIEELAKRAGNFDDEPIDEFDQGDGIDDEFYDMDARDAAEVESDNEWGVPVLRLDRQVTRVPLPFVKWGSIARSSKMTGCYHFYTDDYKFLALWRNPEAILKSGCRNVVEINFSTHTSYPKAITLFNTFRKRSISRLWQDLGVNVMVDMNVEMKLMDINLLGVPKGWRSYCTRAYTDDYMTEVPAEYEIACEHAGTDDILFVVYGGGKKSKAMCKDNGWLWFPEHSDSIRGRE